MTADNFHFVEWVQEVWAQDFLDIHPLTEDMKENLIGNEALNDNLARLHGVLLPWAAGKEATSGEGICCTYIYKVSFPIFIIVLD